MNRGKKPAKLLASSNSKIYMDLKDVIRENCLIFLPAKSLVRFQKVCRDWKLQISSPFFAHNQSQSCRWVLGAFSQIPGYEPSFISFDGNCCGVPDPALKFMHVPVEIMSSSNGLLCCQATSGDKAYYVCNPVTKQWTKLPKPNADHGPDPAIVLVFEPSLLNFIAEYKLICAFQSNDFEDALEFDIYSSREGSWKTSGAICFNGTVPIPASGVHVNNVVYWMTQRGGILAFDLIKDRSLHSYSYSYKGYGDRGALGNLNGKLYSAQVNGRNVILSLLGNPHTNTMEMPSLASPGQKFQPIALDSKICGGEPRVVFVGGNVLLFLCVNKLYSYNLKTKETEEVGEGAPHEPRRFVPYVNSLVSI